MFLFFVNHVISKGSKYISTRNILLLKSKTSSLHPTHLRLHAMHWIILSKMPEMLTRARALSWVCHFTPIHSLFLLEPILCTLLSIVMRGEQSEILVWGHVTCLELLTGCNSLMLLQLELLAYIFCGFDF